MELLAAQETCDELRSNHFNFPSYKQCVPSEFLDLFSFEKEEYCRCFFLPNAKEKQRNKFIGSTKKSKSINESKKENSNRSTVSKIKAETGLNNIFWTPNEFFGWRQGCMLAKVSANWIDIDTVEHQKLSDSDALILFSKVFLALKEAHVPPPTGYVLTGFGGMSFSV